jgi:hypothetical protein
VVTVVYCTTPTSLFQLPNDYLYHVLVGLLLPIYFPTNIFSSLPLPVQRLPEQVSETAETQTGQGSYQ